MPDRRTRRAANPRDAREFAPRQHVRLRTAARQLSWLLAEGFNGRAAGVLVGDHHQLTTRQRLAVGRAACTPTQARHRQETLRPIADARVVVDGFNQLVHLEAGLHGAVLLRCRDGRSRDMASVHGTWRRVEGTEAALEQLVAALAPAAAVVWILDRPVSNSGRLAALLRELGQEVELHDAADRALVHRARDGFSVATADGPLLDRVGSSVALADALALAARPCEDPLVVDLRPRPGAQEGDAEALPGGPAARPSSAPAGAGRGGGGGGAAGPQTHR